MSGYNFARAERNLQALHTAGENLTGDEQRAMVGHFLGRLAGAVDEETWADLLEQACRFVEETDE